MADANSLIMGSSVPSATFNDIGTEHKGTITEHDVMQARVFGTGELAVWKDGSPKMQAVITLLTDERDPEIEDDNGTRRLYVSSKLMKEAVAQAVRKAGATGIAVGGKLAVKYVKNGEGQNAANPPKVYQAFYKAPEAGVYEEAPAESAVIDEYGEYSDDVF